MIPATIDTPNLYVSITWQLSDKKIVRNRSVYDLITLIAEVSGFADIFMVFASVFLKIAYKPTMLNLALLNHV